MILHHRREYTVAVWCDLYDVLLPMATAAARHGRYLESQATFALTRMIYANAGAGITALQLSPEDTRRVDTAYRQLCSVVEEPDPVSQAVIEADLIILRHQRRHV